MLNWVCAMACEAKPVIDFYRLKKSPDKSLPFSIYQNSGVNCIVSGIGSNQIRSALNWASANLPSSSRTHWINLGIAGHKRHPVGTALLIDTVKSWHDAKTITLNPAQQGGLQQAAIISMDSEITDYDKNALHDMEAYAFARHCQQQNILADCHCIKIVSDNMNSAPSRNKAAISALIADKLPVIIEYAQSLEVSGDE